MGASHHSSEDAERQARFISEILGTAQRKWPQGRIEGEDDGETAFAIAANPFNKIVRIQFSKPMLWLGLGKEETISLAKMLMEKADELEGVKA